MSFIEQSIRKTNEAFTEVKRIAETYGGGDLKAALRELDARTKADDIFPAEYESYHKRGSQDTRHLKEASEKLIECFPLELPGITLSRWMPVGNNAYSVFNLPAVSMTPSFTEKIVEWRKMKMSMAMQKIHPNDVKRMNRTSVLFMRYVISMYQWRTLLVAMVLIATYTIFTQTVPWTAIGGWALLFSMITILDSEDDKSSSFGFWQVLHEPVPDSLRDKIIQIRVAARKALENKDIVVVFAEDVHTLEVQRGGNPAGFKLRVGSFPRTSTVAVLLCIGGKQDNPMPALPKYYLIDSYKYTATGDL